LLLGATDRAIRLVDRFAACFADSRTPELTRFGAKHQEAGLRTLLL
jgi:hypothetical protein